MTVFKQIYDLLGLVEALDSQACLLFSGCMFMSMSIHLRNVIFFFMQA